MTRDDFWARYFRYYMFRKLKRERAASRFKALQQQLAAGSAAAVSDMQGTMKGADEDAAAAEDELNGARRGGWGRGQEGEDAGAAACI